jgi:hypothetical protein
MFNKGKKLLVTSIAILTLGFASSCGNNSANIQIPGITGPTVTLMQDNLMVSIVFQNVMMDGGLRYNIPKYKYSFMEVSPDLESTGTLMNISISLKDIVDGGLDKLDPPALPGGRNLPGVVGGSLPAVAFSIEKFSNMTFYLGKDIFGIFLPAAVGVDGGIASFRYYMNQKAAGTISLVGSDDKGENSGMLLMINLTGATKAKMMNIYKKYNR